MVVISVKQALFYLDVIAHYFHIFLSICHIFNLKEITQAILTPTEMAEWWVWLANNHRLTMPFAGQLVWALPGSFAISASLNLNTYASSATSPSICITAIAFSVIGGLVLVVLAVSITLLKRRKNRIGSRSQAGVVRKDDNNKVVEEIDNISYDYITEVRQGSLENGNYEPLPNETGAFLRSQEQGNMGVSECGNTHMKESDFDSNDTYHVLQNEREVPRVFENNFYCAGISCLNTADDRGLLKKSNPRMTGFTTNPLYNSSNDEEGYSVTAATPKAHEAIFTEKRTREEADYSQKSESASAGKYMDLYGYSLESTEALYLVPYETAARSTQNYIQEEAYTHLHTSTPLVEEVTPPYLEVLGRDSQKTFQGNSNLSSKPSNDYMTVS